MNMYIVRRTDLSHFLARSVRFRSKQIVAVENMNFKVWSNFLIFKSHFLWFFPFFWFSLQIMLVWEGRWGVILIIFFFGVCAQSRTSGKPWQPINSVQEKLFKWCVLPFIRHHRRHFRFRFNRETELPFSIFSFSAVWDSPVSAATLCWTTFQEIFLNLFPFLQQFCNQTKNSFFSFGLPRVSQMWFESASWWMTLC